MKLFWGPDLLICHGQKCGHISFVCMYVCVCARACVCSLFKGFRKLFDKNGLIGQKASGVMQCVIRTRRPFVS